MKFLALLSGGKDSCYNIIKCQEYGHELICLANLAPPDSFVGEEMNSFMYQSAGHAIIPLMSECFGVPLIRRQIIGSAVNQRLDYEPSDNDEVEDLYLLIKDVKDKFPEVQGVSCGAIVSNYQRFRVENVCGRLGLTPLTYLWQRDRPALLNEMILSGVNAILVKVAGAGLEPYKHLGKSLSELHPTLTRLNQRFGLDVCGEGGEYESMVLDCSAFRSRLVVDSAEVVVDEEDAAVGNLRLTCHCEVKETNSNTIHSSHDILYSQMKTCSDTLILSRFDDADNNLIDNSISSSSSSSSSIGVSSLCLLSSVVVGDKGLGQTELIHAQSSVIRSSNSNTSNLNMSVQTQLRDILTRLTLSMQREGATLSDAVFVHLYISSVGLFAAVNEEYCKWFGKHPPSRSCVIVPLSFGRLVALDATFLVGSHKSVSSGQLHTRNVLHVQSVSEWAPLCIGPYCQANTIHNAVIFVAGQIPLDPATMTLLTVDKQTEDVTDPQTIQRSLLNAQLTLACRHVGRVLEVQSSSLQNTLSCTVFVNTSNVYVDKDDGEKFFEEIRFLVLRLLQTNCNSLPVSGGQSRRSGSEESDCEQSDEEEEEIRIARSIPVTVVGVSGLPRDALVEVELTAMQSGDLPEGALHYLQSQGGAVGGVIDIAVEEQSVEDEVNSWPLWGNRTEGGDGVQSGVNNSSSSGDDKLSYVGTHSHVQVSRCLCSGFCHVAARTSPSDILWYVNANDAVSVLVTNVRDAMFAAQIDPRRHLHGWRVYFRPEEFEEDALQRAFVRSLSSVLRIQRDFPVLLIPVTALSGSSLLTVQYMATDLIQLETEFWIHKRN